LEEPEKHQTRFVKELTEEVKDLKNDLTQLKVEEKCKGDVAFKWELLTCAIII
jgi:hypothetical protein